MTSTDNRCAETKSVRPEQKALIYACSGCSDVGELADRVARRLAREGFGEMSCIAGIGGGVKSLVSRAAVVQRILVIDGCVLVCAKKTLELAGFKSFEHLSLHELGLRKNSNPVDEERISVCVNAAKKIILQT